MAEELSVDPQHIRRSGAGVRSSAQQLRSELQAFQNHLAGYGEPWGNDDLGSLIGGCYQAISELAFDCYNDNIAELEGHADGVNAMASTYFQAEDVSAIEVNRVHDVLG